LRFSARRSLGTKGVPAGVYPLDSRLRGNDEAAGSTGQRERRGGGNDANKSFPRKRESTRRVAASLTFWE